MCTSKQKSSKLHVGHRACEQKRKTSLKQDVAQQCAHQSNKVVNCMLATELANKKEKQAIYGLAMLILNKRKYNGF